MRMIFFFSRSPRRSELSLSTYRDLPGAFPVASGTAHKREHYAGARLSTVPKPAGPAGRACFCRRQPWAALRTAHTLGDRAYAVRLLRKRG